MEVTLEAPPSSAFPTGKVTVANASSGVVQVSAGSTKTSDGDFSFKLTLEESVAGAFKLGKDSMELKLPSGYKWTVSDESKKIPATSYGQDIYVRISPNDDELTIDFLGTYKNESTVTEATYTPSKWEIGNLKFTTQNDGTAKPGPIMAKLSGKTDLDKSELRVGIYGETGTTVSATEPPKIVAGKDEQRIADIAFKESLGKSLTTGRTITLTLPDGARFQSEYEGNNNSPARKTEDNGKGLNLTFQGYTGTENRTAKFEVTGETGSKVGEFILKDLEVALAADFFGDLEVEIGGSAGVKGKVKVAEVLTPITATTNDTPVMRIGLVDQEGAEITIKENMAAAFEDDEIITLDLPKGVTFANTPKVEVTEGDINVTNVRRTNLDKSVAFQIIGDSTAPSTIVISNVELNVDRTVAEGEIELKINGTSLFETKSYEDWKDIDAVAKVNIGRVGTPAPKETQSSASFTIDNPQYTISGLKKTADVSPYIKEGRTYIPIRYVAEALGVIDSNIIWDELTKTVTLIKGDRIAQLQIGSSKLIINGVATQMDAAAEIKDGRSTLPLRYVALAFGAKVDWDEATKTININ